MNIAVVTVCFQAEAVLEKTIRSVLSQSYPAQYLILDGASKDNSLQIIQKYSQNLTYWHSQPDKGIYDAMNQAIKLANAQWICFLNAGDLFVNEQVLEQVAKHDADVIYGDYLIQYQYHKKYKKVPLPQQLDALLNGMCLNHQSVFIRKSVLESYPFGTEFGLAADFEQILRIFLAKHSFSYIGSAVASFADGGASSVRKIEYLKQCHQIVQKYSPHSDSEKNFEEQIKQTQKVQKLRKLLPAFVFEALMWLKNTLL